MFQKFSTDGLSKTHVYQWNGHFISGREAVEDDSRSVKSDNSWKSQIGVWDMGDSWHIIQIRSEHWLFVDYSLIRVDYSWVSSRKPSITNTIQQTPNLVPPDHLIWYHVTSSYSIESKNLYEKLVLIVWRH